MNPEQKSVTAAFVVVFVLMAARKGWADSIISFLKSKAKSVSGNQPSQPTITPAQQQAAAGAANPAIGGLTP